MTVPMKNILKKLWKQLPGMGLFLRLLCLLRLSARRQEKQISPAAPVYVFGCFQAGGGLSRSAELYARELEKTHPGCIRVDTARETGQSLKNPITDGSIRSLADIVHDDGAGTVILHHNPPQLHWILCLLGRRFLRHKRIVAYMVWELEDLPPLWKHALRYVDAVETPSSFSRAAIARHTSRSVTVRPHPVPEPPDAQKRQKFCTDGKLRCLFIFDLGSLASRKYPEAAIAAFVRAFGPEEGLLTLKVGQPGAYPADFQRLEQITAQHPHIRLLADWLDDAALHRLYLEHDVYLSLHRSEGYGLTIHEAMLRGLYVVATGWSGNMDFMQGEQAYAVPCQLIPVERKYARFNSVPGARWAEPDIGAAAEILRALRERLIRENTAPGAGQKEEPPRLVNG